MSESPTVGARVPPEWQQQIQEIAKVSGRKAAEAIREAICQYLGQTDPAAVKGRLDALEDRVTELERKQAKLRQLVGR